MKNLKNEAGEMQEAWKETGGKPPKLDEASDSNGNSGQKEKKKK